MLEKAFARHGLDWRYLTIDVAPEDLADAVRGIRAMSFRGGNITKPHKIAVVSLLDRLSEAAALMGAVNCLVRDGRELVGENTDGKGFLKSLKAMIDPAGKRVAILGAGGAARAIAVELALAGVAAIEIVNRTEEPGRELAQLLTEKAVTQGEFSAEYKPWRETYRPAPEIDVLVNATSIGMNDDDAAVDIDFTSRGDNLLVADVIVNPPDTRFLREARDHGTKTIDGVGMLVNQGVIGFELWTGIQPDEGVMRDAVEEYLEI